MPKRAPSRPLPGMAALAAPTVRTQVRRATGSMYEQALAAEVVAMGLPRPQREWRFHPVRKWRFDLAWPERLLAVEVEGGGFVQGRHTRGAGMEGDCVKYNEAALLGWTVIRVTPGMVRSGQAIKYVWRALGGAAAYHQQA